MNRTLQTTVEISGVVVEAGDTVPLTMKADGSRNYQYQRQTFTGVYHDSTKRVLRKFNELITEHVMNHTTLHRDVSSIVTSYIKTEVTIVDCVYSYTSYALLVSIPPVEDVVVAFRPVDGTALLEVTSRATMQSMLLTQLHHRMSHEVMVFYMDLLSEALAQRTPAPLQLIQKTDNY